MKNYWVMWTYIANYSEPIKVLAIDAKDAIDKVCGYLSADFQKKAHVYVFDRAPVMTRDPS